MEWWLVAFIATVLGYLFLIWAIPLPDYLEGRIPPRQYFNWGIVMSILIPTGLLVGCIIAILVMA